MNTGLKRSIPGIESAGIFILVFAFYLYTLAPSLNWGDGARIQMDIMLGGSSYAHLDEVADIRTDGLPFDRLGVAAWDHPLYVMLGQVFLQLPFGEPSYRLNWMSAFFGALGIALVYRLGLAMTGDRFAALLGGLALAVSHTYWFHSITTEVYTLHTLLMAAEIGLALRWADGRRFMDLILFALIAGLGIANHRLFGLTTIFSAGYMLFAWISSRRAAAVDQKRGGSASGRLSRAAVLGAAFAAGFAPWWVQFIRMSRTLGAPLTLHLAVTFSLIEDRLAVPSSAVLFQNMGAYLAWLLYQFLPLGVGVGIYGFYRLKRTWPAVGIFLGGLLLGYLAFSANFTIADQFSHHLSSFLVFDLGLIWGFSSLTRLLNKTGLPGWRTAGVRALLLFLVCSLPLFVYAQVPRLFRSAGITEVDFGIYPLAIAERDTLAYFLNPDKRGDDSAARAGRATLAQLAPDAVVFTPKTSEQEVYVVLRYLQRVEGIRPDVRLDMMLFDPMDDMPQAVLARASGLAHCRPVYFSSLNPVSFPAAELAPDYELAPEANLYRLRPRRPEAASSSCENLDVERGLTLGELVRRALRWR